jgi:molybdopterin synthase catalytic subunit
MKLGVGTHPKGTVSLDDILNDLKGKYAFNRAGAIATFTGVVRGSDGEGSKVQKLMIEAYEEKADEEIVRICKTLGKKEGIVDVQIHHLVGEFSVGEDLVYVAVAGEHREEVFSVLKEAVEEYKKEVPIFKKEYVKNKQGKIKSCWVTENES